MLTLQEFHTLEELEAIRTQWQALFRNCPDVTPFQSPDWLIPWWKHLSLGALCFVTFRDRDKLLGIAPFVLHNNQLLLMGSGVSDYADIIAEPSARSEVIAALTEYLSSNSNNWDTCHFQPLRPGSALLEMNAPDGCSSHVFGLEPCPALKLGPAQKPKLQEKVPRTMFKKFDYYRRRLTRLGQWSLVLANEDNFPELFEALISNHQDRRNLRGELGTFSNSRARNFHREAAMLFRVRNLLRLYGLRFDGKIVASLYGFSLNETLFFYATGFSTQYSRLDPGTVIIGEALQQAIREGNQVFDFLRGEEPYKYHWGATDTPVFRREICPAIRPQTTEGVAPPAMAENG